jgi:hypothetical protein
MLDHLTAVEKLVTGGSVKPPAARRSPKTSARKSRHR